MTILSVGIPQSARCGLFDLKITVQKTHRRGKVEERLNLLFTLQTRNSRLCLFDPRPLFRLCLRRLLYIVLAHICSKELFRLLTVIVDRQAKRLQDQYTPRRGCRPDDRTATLTACSGPTRCATGTLNTGNG